MEPWWYQIHKSWQWFLSRDLHTFCYREHETWNKYKWPLRCARRHIELQTDTSSKSQRPYCLQVCRIILKSITSTHLRIVATRMDVPLDPSGPPLYSAKEEYTYDTKLRTSFKIYILHWQKWLVSHLKFSDTLNILQSNFTPWYTRSVSYI